MVANAMKLALVIHTVLDLGVIGHKTQSTKHKTGIYASKKEDNGNGCCDEI